MFTSDVVILQDVADALKLASVNDLPAYWSGVVSRTHRAAYQEIVGALVMRGFTKTQVDAWDRGEEFERQIALYFCFTSPQGAGQFDLNAVKVWDRREELKSVQVYDLGVAVSPTQEPGTVGVGDVAESAGLFNFKGLEPNDCPVDW